MTATPKIDVAAVAAEAEKLLNLPPEVTEKPSVPAQFELCDDGVYSIDESNRRLKICSYLEVVAETHTAIGEGYGRYIKWRDSKDRWHEWAMPIELVHSDSNEHIKYLVSRGLELTPSRKNREKVSLYLATSKPNQTRICTDKTGWQDGVFVLPDTTIGKPADENSQIIFQAANSINHRFRVKGTVGEWRENVARLCVGNSRLVVAVSTAFAACLLTPLSENGGGFHINGPSSLGKSTGLLVGGSVWGGDDRRGFLNTWRTTANGLESVAELHNDSLLCLDELKECDPKAASESAYMLANGEGKGRMTRNVNTRRSLTWNLLFLSSGELGLSDVVQQIGGRTYGGQEVRMCDISADAGKGLGLFENIHGVESAELFAKTLQENARRFYGSASREFLAQVSLNLENLKNQWIRFRQSFMKNVLPANPGEEVQRVASRFALVAFGGWLARDICGWSETESISACQTVYKSWLNSRSGGNTDAESAISQVRHFLEMHGQSRFQNLDSTSSFEEKIINRAGYKRRNAVTDETEFLILPETFRKEVCKSFDAKNVASNLARLGFLLHGSGDSNTRNVKIDGVQQRFYILTSKIFEAREGE